MTKRIAELARPEHVGHCCIVSLQEIQDAGGPEMVPPRSYAHRIYFDIKTGNFMILRPQEDGTYHIAHLDQWRLIHDGKLAT